MKRTFLALKVYVPLVAVCMLVSCYGNQNLDTINLNTIDLNLGTVENIIVLESRDSLEAQSSRRIILPEFKKFVHVAADAEHFRWIGASNRMFPWVGKNDLNAIFKEKEPAPPRIPDANRRALTMMFELANGNYLTLLPLSGSASTSWLEVTKAGELILDYGSLGTRSIPKGTNVPLMAWYESANMYESLRKTWELALSHDKVKAMGSLRKDKEYPEPLEHLGWCTWEQYRKNINEEILVSAIDKIESSGIPVRWFLIDDGHQDDKGRLLKSFMPNPKKFPNGWNPIVSRKHDDAIKWMGIWHGFLSHWDGVHVDHDMEELVPFLTPNPSRKNGLLPKDDMESSMVFYEYLVTTIKNQGFDFMKTDNVSRSTLEYAKFPNASKAQRQNVLALEESCYKHGISLMNCSAQNTIDMLNTSNSATMRTSPDYQKHNLPTSKSQILQSVFNVTWLGQTLWPDHDMFHSSDEEVGEAMSVTKAMSGGPIYLSDDPSDFKHQIIAPLCYADGKLIRPEAPGAPMPASIFNDALYENKSVYMTIAPLKNRACAIAAYNLSITAKNALTGKIKPEDYAQAPVMMQPFEGLWEVPSEGLVIYDWKEQQGQKLNQEGLNFEMNEFGHKLFLLSPINNGWAVIGRPDKYLSPSTLAIVKVQKENLVLEFIEVGPLVLYMESGTPSSEQMDFVALGNNFYIGDPVKGLKESSTVQIKKIND